MNKNKDNIFKNKINTPLSFPDDDYDYMAEEIGYFMDHLKFESYKETIDNLQDGETPDKTGCEYLFLEDFITGKMSIDFPIIARDFLRHEMHTQNGYTKNWLDPEDEFSFCEQIIDYKILNMMMDSFRSGSDYTKSMFQHLYKIYYKKEYKQFKRFRSFKATDIISMSRDDPDSVHDIHTSARILFMADVFNIDIHKDAYIFYIFMNEYMHRMEKQKDQEINDNFEDVFTTELFRECLDVVGEWIDKDSLDTHGRVKLKKFTQAERFSHTALKYYHFPTDYILRINDDYNSLKIDLAKTLAILRTANPKKNYDYEDTQIYMMILFSIGALTNLSDNVNNRLGRVLGAFRDLDDDECLYKPVETNAASQKPVENQKNKPQSGSNPVGKSDVSSSGHNSKKSSSDQISDADNSDEFMKIIHDLQSRLHQQEQETRHYKNVCREKIKETKEKDALLQKYEEEHLELIALRDHVYQSTEADITVPSIDPVETEKAIASKKIVIIGGHDNWTNKLKKRFEKWIFIKPHVSSSINESLIQKADYIYFFTDFICHSNYYKFMNVVRAQKLPFGYIHTINIETNIRQIYEEVCKEG